MIRAEHAIAAARSLAGTPYSQMDCIALIRTVIRRSRGGVPDYRCEGTNWLWSSIGNSGKYRHLTARQENITGAQAGMLAFKREGENVHHVGLVTEKGTVIHSSSVQGCVVETQLCTEEGWSLLGTHRYIDTSEQEMPEAAEDGQTEDAAHTTLVCDATGMMITLSGAWRVAQD